MVLHLLSADQVASSCRQRIESCELWLRYLIHNQLSGTFGADYLSGLSPSNNPIFSASVRRNAASRYATARITPPRPVDTLLFDDLASVLAKADVYNEWFKTVLHTDFPLGSMQIKNILPLLVPIRNKLAHANGVTLTLHEAERALCYCNDLISAIQNHYTGASMADKFPAPIFTRISDSQGNVHYPSDHRPNFYGKEPLRCGDTIRFEVEVDSTFSPNEYDISWVVNNIANGQRGTGPIFSLVLDERHVGLQFSVSAMLVSHKSWHRDQNFDAMAVLRYKVLPPPA
ncbi:hypothetical protein DWV07_03775 [Dickeya zeae]|nr:hypothetical protein DWV07_03775 [Dickeya zeae]